MEVHAPEHPIHTWRDFFVHMATITVGLLIAIALEQSVEWMHRKHQLHVAEHNLRVEIDNNMRTLQGDEAQLEMSRKMLLVTFTNIEKLRTHAAATRIGSQMTWNDMSNAAWDTARNTNTTALMDYADADALSEIYSQQEAVNRASEAYFHDIVRLAAPIAAGTKPENLTPADLDRMEINAQEALADLSLLQAVCAGLDDAYKQRPFR